MNHKRIAYLIVKRSLIPIHLMNTKYINKAVQRYARKRDDFELIKMYIYQIKRREVQHVRSCK